MELTCARSELNNAVFIGNRFIGKNLSLPVLSSLFLEASDRKLVLRATNLEVGVEFSLPAAVSEPGTVAVSGAVFNSYLGALGGGGDLNLSTDKIGNLVVKNSRGRTLIKAEPNEDFPSLPKAEGTEISLPGNVLAAGVQAVVYAASVSEMKPEIGSVFMRGGDDELIFAATDSFRLAEKRLRLQGIDFPSLLIPQRNALELARLLSERPGEIKFIAGRDLCGVQGEGYYFTSRLVSGVYPDYEQLIPANSSTSAVVSKDDLLSALKLASIFTDKFSRVTFSIKTGERVFSVSSNSEMAGESETIIPAAVEGEPINMNFNARYLLDAFQSLSGDSILIFWNGPSKPLLLRGAQDKSFTYLVMPLTG